MCSKISNNYYKISKKSPDLQSLTNFIGENVDEYISIYSY